MVVQEEGRVVQLLLDKELLDKEKMVGAALASMSVVAVAQGVLA
jgi:hypothetical protein